MLATGVALLLFLPTKNDTLTGGVIAILTLAVNQGFENARRKSEERRWYAEHFLKDKIESLRTLHAVLRDWYRTLNLYGNHPPDTMKEYEEKVLPKESVFLKAFASASVYLSDEDDKVVREAMAYCRIAEHAIFHGISEVRTTRPGQDRSLPWKEFMQAHDAAVAVLRRLLNPPSLRAVEADLAERGAVHE